MGERNLARRFLGRGSPRSFWGWKALRNEPEGIRPRAPEGRGSAKMTPPRSFLGGRRSGCSGFWGGFPYAFDIQDDVHVVAQEQSPSFHRLVPGDPEIL